MENIFRFHVSLVSNNQFCHSYKSLSKKHTKGIFKNFLHQLSFGNSEKRFGSEFH